MRVLGRPFGSSSFSRANLRGPAPLAVLHHCARFSYVRRLLFQAPDTNPPAPAPGRRRGLGRGPPAGRKRRRAAGGWFIREDEPDDAAPSDDHDASAASSASPAAEVAEDDNDTDEVMPAAPALAARSAAAASALGQRLTAADLASALGVPLPRKGAAFTQASYSRSRQHDFDSFSAAILEAAAHVVSPASPSAFVVAATSSSSALRSDVIAGAMDTVLQERCVSGSVGWLFHACAAATSC
jgi:hypothetical protein